MSWSAEERLRLAVETTETGLWTWEVDTGAVTWTAQCYRIHGLAPGSFEGTADHFFRLVHPADRERVDRSVRTAVQERRLYESEFRVLRPDGGVVWVANRGRAQYDASGRAVSMQGTILDITDRKTSEQRMQVALEASGSGTFRWDIRTDDLSWDEALDALFGLVPGQAVRGLEQFVARVHPDDRAGVVAACARCKESAADFEMEFRVVHPDGTIRWLHDRGRTFTDAAGRALYMTGACVDITDRKRTEDALRQSEAFYRRTLESVPGMTFSTTEDGDCDYLSEQWVAYTGVRAAEHFGRHWIQALHPEDRPLAGAAWETAVRTRSPYDAEYRMRRHDGAYRWFKAQGHLIPSPGGMPGRWIGTIVDVHALKEAQAALQERERELRTVADNSPDIIVRYDRALRHVFINAAVERVTGKPMALFLGRTNQELGMPADLCELWDNAIRKVFDERRTITSYFEFEVEGSVRHFAARMVPEIGESGAVDHVLGVTRDVTDAWLAQEALRRADRQKDDFLATLAHELRNPLAPLRTGLSVLQRGPSAGEEQRVRQIMERQLEHMVRLVDELLDIARISQGKVVLRREVLPLALVLEHAVDAGRPLLDAQGHTLVWHGVDPAWQVHGDITRLAQVVGNLLNNAAKYTPPGGRVTLSAVEEGADLRLTVEDTGVGIPRDMLARVFDRFVQAEQHLDRAQGGLGIGLSVVRALVEMHGGRVAAESPGPGLGSRFHVWLPRAHDRPAPIAVRAPAAARGSAPKRVLIVDDNQDAAETLAMVVQFHGHEIRVASDGPSALVAAREHQPDIVFLDIGMPGMSGYDVATQMRALPGWDDRLLVALTGWGTQEDRAKSLAAGFDVHLTKPVELDAVEHVLAGTAPARH
jgi:PAS domain S-box-containing protein